MFRWPFVLEEYWTAAFISSAPEATKTTVWHFSLLVAFFCLDFWFLTSHTYRSGNIKCTKRKIAGRKWDASFFASFCSRNLPLKSWTLCETGTLGRHFLQDFYSLRFECENVLGEEAVASMGPPRSMHLLFGILAPQILAALQTTVLWYFVQLL